MMHMHMPNMPGMHGTPMHHRHPARKAMMAFFGLFWLSAVVCMLGAVNRGANALKTQARIKALTKFPDAFTEEERAQLTHKIAARAMGPF